MTIRTRLTLWYAGMLLGSFLLMFGILHYELIGEYERNKVEPPRVKIEDILVSYGVPTLLVLVLGGSWFMRRAMRPVETLVAAAERIHAANLTERLPLSGRQDELDRLAVVFNTMLARVEAGVASVREFTLHVSHELKTPLSVLSAETELALNDPAIPGPERSRLKSQQEEIRRLSTLVDALGLLAKADAGARIVTREPVNFDALVRATVEDVRSLAASRGITMELVRCDAASLEGDRAGLRQVLLNLLDNAVKHNRPEGWVHVQLQAGIKDFTLLVENTGTPISPELLPHVFDRFVRGSGVTEGTGLGLSITKTIVEAHGGKISAGNPVAGGVRFTIHLPRLVR